MNRLLLAALSFALITVALTSCQSPADTARLGNLADLAITYSARRGILTAADVAALRAAQVILLPPVTDRPLTLSGK